MTANTELIAPTQQDARLAAKAVSRLSGYLDRPDDVKIQVGIEGKQESLAVPQMVVHLLSRILKETASGHAVSVVPFDSEMTTSEAADYLNVSRPYVIGLLEQGKIPFHKVGSHRRIRIEDVAEYKRRQMATSYAAMEELQAQAEDLNMEF
jgi:excisionase family DNA binding protein